MSSLAYAVDYFLEAICFLLIFYDYYIIIPNQPYLILISDVDECKKGSNRCDANALCMNTNGGYTCECKVGFQGDGFHCVGTAHKFAL